MQAAVIIFPGSNCDRDMITTIKQNTGKDPLKIWHTDNEIPNNIDFIAIPGGFSFGDYLRSGAMSAKSPIMKEVIKAAQRGVYILGVCNGFQILTESGLLPGTLMRNKNLKFICKTSPLKVSNNNTAFTKNYTEKQTINIPIAHHDGNYFASDDTIKTLQDNEQIAFEYIDNPNGSKNNIAGIFDKNKKILGMMPHPERAVNEKTGGVDGANLFKGLFEALN